MNVEGKETTTNAPTNTNYDDNSMNENGQESLLLDQSPTDQGNTFGNQPQNISRDKILQLYKKVQSLHRTDEKDLLATLSDALKNLTDFQSGDDSQAALEYEQVYQEIGGAKADANASGGEGSPSLDTSGDTEPDTKDDSAKVWDYSGYKSGDVTVHAVEGHDSKINVRGKAKIILSAGQTADVSRDSSNDSYRVTVKDQNQPITTLTVSAQAESLNIDGPPSAVTVEDPSNSDKIQIQGVALSQTSQGVSAITGLLSGMTSSQVDGNLKLSWASDDPFNSIIHGLVPLYNGLVPVYNYPYISGFVSSAAEGISKGMSSGNWGDLKSSMDKLVNEVAQDPNANGVNGEWADGNRENGYKALFMSLYSVLGESKLHAVFAKMSADDPDTFSRFKGSFSTTDGKGGTLNPLDKNRDNASWATGAWASSEVGGWTDAQVKSFIEGNSQTNKKSSSNE